MTSHKCPYFLTLAVPSRLSYIYSQSLEICVPELVSNGTRQDETGRQFPNWRDQDKTTSLWSRCLGKFGKNYLYHFSQLWNISWSRKRDLISSSQNCKGESHSLTDGTTERLFLGVLIEVYFLKAELCGRKICLKNKFYRYRHRPKKIGADCFSICQYECFWMQIY